MKKVLISILRFLPLMAFLISGVALSAENKILMVVSGYGQDKGEKAPGYEFDEFSKAWLVFHEHGISVDVASPKGGKVEADKYDPTSAYNAKVLANNSVMAQLDNTLKTSEVQASDYDAVFVVGGKGAMFDLPKDTALQSFIADVYQQQGVVAAVCHGPAALVDVKLADGSYLVANKAVNAFTNKEENLFASKWLPDFPFMLEDKLVQRGGEFQSSDIMLNHVVKDERLITGQNPSSTVAVAMELVKSLGVEPQPLPAYKDDKTLALVAQVLEGDSKATDELNSHKQDYNIQLVGMYGYFYLNVAKSSTDFQNALTLMTLAQDTINSPRLDMQIAKTQQKLGDAKAAVQTLNDILADKPDFEPAKEMLASLSE